MNLYAARDLALALMRQHGLNDWTFRFDHARRRFGSCQPRRKVITLSRPLAFLNAEPQVRDTVLHEIAHALTPGDGHGSRWKRKCVEIGAEPFQSKVECARLRLRLVTPSSIRRAESQARHRFGTGMRDDRARGSQLVPP